MKKGQRRAILVVGMHRSGTSATTRVLNLLGAALPGTIIPGDAGNELGHWEAAEAVGLNDRMLWSAGVNVNGVFPIDRGWFGSAEAAAFTDEATAFLSGVDRTSPLIALKDPRGSLFIPVWRRALDRAGFEACFLHAFRHPLEVAASMTRRQLQHFPDSVWPHGRGTLVWMRYVLAAEAATRGTPRSFVSFDALVADWRAEAARVARQLGLQWPAGEAQAAAIDAFLDCGRKHESASGYADVSPWFERVHRQLLACQSTPAAGAGVFDGAARALDEASAFFHDYVEGLEARIAATPSLRTEFPDFPPPRGCRETRTPSGPSLTPGLKALLGR